MMDLSSIRAANQLDPQQWGQCNALGVTPFHQLAERADGAPALRMLGAALPNLLSVRDSKNRTAFDAALERGCTEALQALLDVGYELHPFDERDPLHWRLLGLSVRDQNLALLRHTLQLSRAEKNMNPILWETHDTEHGWVFRHRLSGYSLLHAAIDAESPEGVEALLTLGLSVDARDFHQDTPLHVLCQRCLSRGTTRLRRKLLELLVGAGASLHALDVDHLSALDILELREGEDIAPKLCAWARETQQAQLTMLYGDRSRCESVEGLKIELRNNPHFRYLVSALGLEHFCLAWIDKQSNAVYSEHIHTACPRALTRIDQLVIERTALPELEQRYPGVWCRLQPDASDLSSLSNDAVLLWYNEGKIFALSHDCRTNDISIQELKNWRDEPLPESVRRLKAQLSQRYEMCLREVAEDFADILDSDEGLRLQFNPSKQNYTLLLPEHRNGQSVSIDSKGISRQAVQAVVELGHACLPVIKSVRSLPAQYKVELCYSNNLRQIYQAWQDCPSLDAVVNVHSDRCEVLHKDPQSGLLIKQDWNPKKQSLTSVLEQLKDVKLVTEQISTEDTHVLWQEKPLQASKNRSEIHLSFHSGLKQYVMTQTHPVFFGDVDAVWLKDPSLESARTALHRLLQLRRAAGLVAEEIGEGSCFFSWFARRRPTEADIRNEALHFIALYLSDDREGFELSFIHPVTQILTTIPTLTLDAVGTQLQSIDAILNNAHSSHY